MRVGLALQPIATALFANSPFTGQPNGFLSFRSEIWRDTDNDRAGMLPFAFEAGYGVRALCRLRARRADVFRQARRQIHDVAGKSFRDLLGGQAAGPGTTRPVPTGPTICRPSSPRCASSAISRCAAPMPGRGGFARCRPSGSAFLDDTSLDAAWEIVKDWTARGRQALRDAVPREGLTRRSSTAACSTSRRMLPLCSNRASPAANKRDRDGRDERRNLCGRSRPSQHGARPSPRTCSRIIAEHGRDRSTPHI